MAETRLEIASLQSVGGKDEGSRQMTNESPDAEKQRKICKQQQVNEILNCTDTNESRNGEDECSSWLNDIMKGGGDGGGGNNKPPPGSKIPKVNCNVIFKGDVNKNEEENNRSKNESFGPCAVSIGPYHFFDRKGKLNEVEKLKVPMARQFILDSKKLKENGQPDVDLFYSKVAKKAKLTRDFYDKNSTKCFNNKQFTMMMFLDGCFILQFIHCVTGGYEDSKEKESPEIVSFYEKLKDLSDRQVADVKRDLLLLENQLPFPILDALLKERYAKGEEMDRINKFLPFRDSKQPFSMLLLLLLPFLLCLYIFCCLWCCFRGDDEQPNSPGDNKQSVSDDNRQYDHLLGYLYLKFTELTERDAPKLTPGSGKPVYEFISGSGKPKLSLGTRGHYLYYSAKDLKKVGIHFRPSSSSCLKDVDFKPKCWCGILTLPPITIYHSTKSMLSNLMAYEAASKDVSWVRSYIFFMDSLIDDAEDVKELRSKGIISNYLGSDQQVADLFNNMTESLVEPDYRAYNDIKKKINMQCNSKFKKCVADTVHKYFSSPWSFVALIAAGFTIFLTAVATYKAVWPNN